MPDFHQVYSFIGDLFDPSASASEHLKTLKKMDPITAKTVLMLMENLSVNLSSPEFENHGCAYNIGADEEKKCSSNRGTDGV
ncbi:hypothetical protein ACS0TY_019788 [Phlomoides rotata]